ncbi:MAG: plasmid maintenance system killer protein [Clostridiales bacterium]|nr:plasmid maintenance system killer protein [Clostridiales bacterium]
MILSYSSGKLETILNDRRLLKKHYNSDSIKIENRISELTAANNLSEIPNTPPPRRHKLKGNLDGRWAVDYAKNRRIVFQPVGIFLADDLTSITEIIILELCDYH